MPAKPNLLAAAPTLLVADLKAAADWYAEALGFTCAIDWSVNPTFAIVKREGASIMLKEAASRGKANRRHVPALPLFDAYVWVRDIKKLADELHGRGTHVEFGPVTREYGCTEIGVVDPDDHLITFGYCP